MSTSFYCKCTERKKPIDQRNWSVIQRHCNYSAFNGYRKQWSNYSLVVCLSCNAIGRTKAGYVDSIKKEGFEGKTEI